MTKRINLFLTARNVWERRGRLEKLLPATDSYHVYHVLVVSVSSVLDNIGLCQNTNEPN